MVKFWEEAIKKNEKLVKIRIKHCEMHGIGDTAIKEKANLLKTQKKLKDWRLKHQ